MRGRWGVGDGRPHRGDFDALVLKAKADVPSPRALELKNRIGKRDANDKKKPAVECPKDAVAFLMQRSQCSH